MFKEEEKIINKEVQCIHCKESCEDVEILLDGKNFCCLGCKTVYQILHDNGLEAYYKIDKNPGVSLKQNKTKVHYSILDREEIRCQILDFSDDEISKVRLYIPAIHCSSCIWLLENIHKIHGGIIRSSVDFPRKELRIDFTHKIISLRAVVELLGSLGYYPEIRLETSNDRNPIRYRQRDLLVRIGVAGFAFGNIMLFSFPDYLGLDRIIDPDFSGFFVAVSMLFSLPVVFFSASGYFKSAYLGIKQGKVSIDVPIAIGIMALFLRSMYEVATDNGIGYFDSLAGLVFFLLIGKWFQSKTYDNLLFDRNYKSYFPIAVSRLNGNNRIESVTVDELKPGDKIKIRNEELIPADAILLSGEAHIDNSFVTGESALVLKQNGDYIYAGGRQIGPAIQLQVVKDVSHSYLTQLWNMEPTGGQSITDHTLINKVSKYFTLIVLLLAFGSGGFWLLYNPIIAVNAFTAVLIVACPCALALATPFAVGSTMRILGENGCYLKNGDIVEAMARIDCIVFDKTGTITIKNKNDHVDFVGDVSKMERELVFHLSSNSSHPLSRILASKLRNGNGSGGIEEVKVEEFNEIRGMGLTGIVNGIKMRIGSADFTGWNSGAEDDYGASKIYLSINGVNKGFFAIRNTYRKNFEKVIKRFTSYKIALLSGDNCSEKSFLSEIFPKESELKFEQTAFEKLEFIKQKQKTGSKVLMLGDGLNDAGAFAESTVGIAITDDINNFTPASDVILSGEKLSLLPEILSFSKATVKIIGISFILSFLYNIVGLSFAVSGNLTPIFAAILMPLSSISVVVFATLSVNFISRKIGLR